MTSPYPFTPRSKSYSSSYASSSPSWSTSSSPWPSVPPSSSPPMTPTSQHAYTTTINSPGPYFTYMNARYDRSIGRERDLQREWERERESYHEYANRKGKRVEREPPRQTLPSFKEAFGDIEPLNLVPQRNTYSSHSSSSTASSSSPSSYTFSPPMAKASPPFHVHSYVPIHDSPTKRFSAHIPENVFYSSDEEESADYFQRRRRAFRTQPEPSLTERSFSDDEDEDREESRNTYTFSPERRRSTTFETSSERGLWTNSEPKPIAAFPSACLSKRSSEPVIHSLPSVSHHPLSRNPSRHVSEPVIDSDEVWPRHRSSFTDRKDESKHESVPVPVTLSVAHRGRSPSVPLSSPPLSPVSSVSPDILDRPGSSSHLDCSNTNDVDSATPDSVPAGDNSAFTSATSPLGDAVVVGRADCDILMGEIEAVDDVSQNVPIRPDDLYSLQDEVNGENRDHSGRDDEDMTLTESAISSALTQATDPPSDPQFDGNNNTDGLKTEIIDTIPEKEADDMFAAPPEPQTALGTGAISADDGAMSEDSHSCLAEPGLLLSLPSPSPLSSVPSSRRTTPSLDDLIYAMEMEETARVGKNLEEGKLKQEHEDELEMEALSADEPPTQIPIPTIALSSETIATPTSVIATSTVVTPVTQVTTALATSKAAHTNGVQKRTVPSSSSGVEPPLKKRRCKEPASLARKPSPMGGATAAPKQPSSSDTTFFSKSKPHSHLHRPGSSTSRPTAPPSPANRVVVRVISRTVVPTKPKKVAKAPEASASRLKKPPATAKNPEHGVKSKPGRAKEKGKREDVDSDSAGHPAKTKGSPSTEPQPKPTVAKAKPQPQKQKSSIVKKTLPAARAVSKPVTLSPVRARMVIESDSESDSEDDDLDSSKGRSFSSPLSSPVSSDAEDNAKESEEEESSEEDDSEESEDNDDSESEEELPRKRGRQRASVKSTKPKPSSRSKPLSKSKIPPKPLTPLDPRDAEIIGLLIETMAQSRASSHTLSVLYRSIAQSRPTVLARLAEGHYVESDQEMDEDGEGEEKSKGRGRGRGKGRRGEQGWWMREFVRVMELGMGRTGMFGRVESSGKESLDRALDAHYFYVPERDEDQERAALIKSIMPRAGKRTETKKYKQYYWKPVEGKTLRWDAVDGI